MNISDFGDVEFSACGILPGYREASLRTALANLPDQERKKTEAFISGKCQALFLTGHNGSGKTYFGIAAMLERMKKAIVAPLRSDAYGIVEDYLSNYKQLPKKYLTCSTLFIDELGKEINIGKDDAPMVIERIIKYRLERQRPILLATNMSIEAVSVRYGKSLLSMLAGQGYIIEFPDRDFRLQAK